MNQRDDLQRAIKLLQTALVYTDPYGNVVNREGYNLYVTQAKKVLHLMKDSEIAAMKHRIFIRWRQPRTSRTYYLTFIDNKVQGTEQWQDAHFFTTRQEAVPYLSQISPWAEIVEEGADDSNT